MSAEDKTIYKYGDDNANPRFEDSYYVSNWVAKKMYLKRGALKSSKGITTIITPIKLFNGDVFYTKKYPIKYYVIKWEKFNPTGGHILRIGRMDGNLITQVDLDNLTTKSWIQIKGYVKNECTDCDL